MNPIVGWVLMIVAVVAGWRFYGWQGVVMAVTLTAFWLLLQFSRALRAVKNAGQAPVGHVPSAVMFNAKLRAGMTMMQVIQVSKSLGQRVSEVPEVWRWADGDGSDVTLEFGGAKLAAWTLRRPSEPTPPDDAPPSP